MMEAALPVRRDALQDQLHHATSQVRIVRLRQNEKARIVGDEPSTATTLLRGPTDELVAAFKMAGTRAPTAQGQPLAAKGRNVTKLLAHQLMSVEVVMLLHQGLVTFTFVGVDRP